MRVRRREVNPSILGCLSLHIWPKVTFQYQNISNCSRYKEAAQN